MAWHAQGPSGNYFICLRIGTKRFRRSLNTDSKEGADGDVARVEDMVAAIRDEGGQLRLTIIPGAGHGICNEVCSRADLWEWLFKERR